MLGSGSFFHLSIGPVRLLYSILRRRFAFTGHGERFHTGWPFPVFLSSPVCHQSREVGAQSCYLTYQFAEIERGARPKPFRFHLLQTPM